MAEMLRLRDYRAEDRDPVRDLLLRTYGDTTSFDRFEHGNPLGETLRVVAEEEGRIVGFNHWQPWRIPTPDGDVVVHQSGASAVDASMRGRGVFARLLEEGEAAARRRGVEVFFGFPNPASLGSFLRAGWKQLTTMPLRLVLRPATGREGGSPTPGAPAGEGHWPEWRYRLAAVERRVVRDPEGRERVLYFRRERISGLPAVRLLDALTPEGERSLAHLPRLVARLPGPRLVFLRAPAHPGLAGTRTRVIPRAWETPVVAKPIAAAPALLGRLERALFLLGDVDAA